MSITARRYRTALAALAGGALLLVAIGSEARVTRITINSTTSPVFNGQMFGDVGTYEEIRGTATGEIDPLDPRNAVITDIHQAPLNANGKVGVDAAFTSVKPGGMERGSGFFIFCNR